MFRLQYLFFTTFFHRPTQRGEEMSLYHFLCSFHGLKEINPLDQGSERYPESNLILFFYKNRHRNHLLFTTFYNRSSLDC